MIISFKTYQQKRDAMDTSPRKMAAVLQMVVDTLNETNEAQISDRRLIASGDPEALTHAIQCYDATETVADYAAHFLRMYKIKEGV